MINPRVMDAYMTEARLRTLAEALADLGYENDLLLETGGKNEIRIYREASDETFVVDYQILFDDDDSEEDELRAVGFCLRLHRLDGRRLEGSYGSFAGSVIAERQEGLALDAWDTSSWIREQIEKE